jgi:hypothetical protein
MSVNVGDVVIGLRADIAQLQKNMDDAKRSVQGAMKDISQYTGYAKDAFVAFGGVLSINAFKDIITGAIEFKARLIDLSAQTGISVTALGALGKTGKLTGTSLDDITAASAKLSKAISTQNEDSKGAAKAIQDLGLDFNKFKQLRPEDQMLAVARAMQGFADGAGKTSDAMQLFGKTGATLLPFLRDLADRTDLNSKQTLEAAKQAKEFETNLAKLKAAGGEWRDQVVNEMLPALVKFTQQMVEAKTAGEKLATIWANVKGNLGVDDLGIQIKKVAELNREVSDAAAALKVSQQAAASVPGGGTILGWLVDMNRKSLEDLQRQAGTEADILKKMANTASPLIDTSNYSHEGNRPKPDLKGGDPAGTKDKLDDYQKLIKAINDKIAASEAEAESDTKLFEAQIKGAEIARSLEEGTRRLTSTELANVDAALKEQLAAEKLAATRKSDRADTQAAIDASFGRLQALRSEGDALRLEVQLYGLTSDQVKALAIARDLDTAATKRNQAAALDDVGAMGQLKQQLIDQAKQLEDNAALKQQLADKEAREHNDPNAGALRGVRDYLDGVKRAGDATAASVQNALKGLEDTTVAVLTGKGGKNAAKAWVDSIISEVIRLQVVKPMLQSIFGGGGSGGVLGSLLGLAGSFFGSGGGGMENYGANAGAGGSLGGGRASGGPVSAGQSYLVGEKGPEILRMGSSGGSVVPNSALGGGSTVMLNVLNNGEPAKATASQRQTDQGLVIDLVLSAVASDVASGGKVHQALSSTYQINRASGAARY